MVGGVAQGRMVLQKTNICLVATADICPVSTADICPVSTEDICPVQGAAVKAWLAEAAIAAD